jgi:hypothetical protein
MKTIVKVTTVMDAGYEINGNEIVNTASESCLLEVETLRMAVKIFYCRINSICAISEFLLHAGNSTHWLLY